ncbi:RNA-directed DNA polymerase, eukaryota, partial [Tanacetum coccineum]
NSLISSFRRSPRSGIEEEKLLLLISNTSSVILPNISDRWSWLLDSSGDFSVKSTRDFIDDSMLPKTDVPTRWVKSIPIKINIFAWRVSLDKLPSRLNLSLRGLDIPFIICPLCSIAVESTSHLLFSCQLARQLMIKVVHWWELEYQDFHSYEDWLFWFKNLRVSKRLKDVFEGFTLNGNNRILNLRVQIRGTEIQKLQMKQEFKRKLLEQIDALKTTFNLSRATTLNKLENAIQQCTLHEKDSILNYVFDPKGQFGTFHTFKSSSFPSTDSRVHGSKVQSAVTSSGGEHSVGIFSEEKKIDRRKLEYLRFHGKNSGSLPAESSSTDNAICEQYKTMMKICVANEDNYSAKNSA